MNGDETRDDDDISSVTGHHLDLSQSSGIMSLPSGNKLADLSITTDITDSETENEETVLGSNNQSKMKNELHCPAHGDTPAVTAGASLQPSILTVLPRSNESLGNFDNERSDAEKRNGNYMQTDKLPVSTADSAILKVNNASLKLAPMASYSTVPVAENEEEPLTMNTLSLDDVKSALQKNCNLLSDRHLLNDLLKSLDDEIGNNSVITSNVLSSHTNPTIFVPPNRDPGPSLGWKSSNSSNKGILAQNVTESVSDSSSVPLTCDPFHMQTYKSSSLIDIPALSMINSQIYLPNNGSSYEPQDPVRPRANTRIQNNHNNLEVISEETSYDGHLFSSNSFTKIADFVEESVCDKNPEKHVNFQHLWVEEVNPSKVVKNDKPTSSQPEVRVKETSMCDTQAHKILKQLSGLRWRLMGWEEVGASPPTDSRSSLAFIHQLLNMLQVHQIEKKHLEEEVMTIKALLKKMSDEVYIRQSMYEKRETRLLEADNQLGVIQKEWIEAQEAVQTQMLKLTTQCNHLKQERESLKNKVASMEDDIEKLRQSVMDFEKMKASLEEQVKDLSSQVTATRNELHHHYQAQLEDLMGKKSQNLQDQLNKLEMNMKKNLEEQLDVQRSSHNRVCLGLQKGYEKKVRELNSSHTMKMVELQQQLKILEEENGRLKAQHQSIVTAVSSILGVQPEDAISTHDLSNRLKTKYLEEQSNNLRCKVSSRPASGASSRGKSASKSSSRPASGKSARDVPRLGLRSSSSSDSDASVFQEGRQTVRHIHGGSLHTLTANSSLDTGNNGKLWNPRNGNIAGLLGPSNCNINFLINDSDREYRSLPDLQTKSKLVNNLPTEMAMVGLSQTRQKKQFSAENSNPRGKVIPDETRARHGNTSHQDISNRPIHPLYTKKIFKASEIIQASDFTDGELQDQEMEKMLKDLKMVIITLCSNF
ncbi:hypothetical protein OTU49_003919 [Cherax quadricarinatus]|uniref:Uncharacterized protein n=1 Tax=Cherax quadricarinatus TaxID=27406 RepID=A0AAW0X2A4_CHEQU